MSWATFLIAATALTAHSAPVVRTATADLGVYNLNMTYPAMKGPVQFSAFKLENHEPYIWFLGAKIEVFQDGHPAMEDLCHSRLGLVGKRRTTFENNDLDHLGHGMLRLMALSQGESDVNFPKGFGLKLKLPKHERLLFGVQLQYHPQPFRPAHGTARGTIRYMSENDGIKAGLKELKKLRLGPVGQHFHEGEFQVPPGKHVVKFAIPAGSIETLPKVAKIHMLLPHLHAYAKSVALVDKTAGKRIWMGNAQTDLKSESLSHVDVYSDEKGIDIFRDHEYELVAEYDNPTSRRIDAMVFLAAYYGAPE